MTRQRNLKDMDLNGRLNNYGIWKLGTTYDAVLVLDADNLVTPNTLKVLLINALLVEPKYCNFISIPRILKIAGFQKSYAYAYWATNRIYQLAREKLGLSAQLGGTGMF
ncbi:hypothetical protein P7H21_25055 [Paenibacillus larvae]|nr:hypothetical protein [Paenibacillus larvae]MDT2306562.1 hypothetical protein [Paenibacillus larvae]